MGKKSKSSRKGKKAWRANISTEEIEDFFEKSTKDALSGGSLQAVSSDCLFFEDKSKGTYPFLFISFWLFIFRLYENDVFDYELLKLVYEKGF